MTLIDEGTKRFVRLSVDWEDFLQGRADANLYSVIKDSLAKGSLPIDRIFHLNRKKQPR